MINYVSNKSLIFENDITISITGDIDFLLKEYYPHVQNLLKQCIENVGKSKHEKELQKYIKNFPKVPLFYKLLCDEFFRKGKIESYKRFSISYYKKFPEDFFAVLHMAIVHALNEELNKVKLLYGETITLQFAFPNKTIYHISEIIDFLSFTVSYCLANHALDDAIINENKLGEILKDSTAHKNAKEQIANYKRELLPYKSASIEIVGGYKDIYKFYNFTEEETEVIKRRLLTSCPIPKCSNTYHPK